MPDHPAFQEGVKWVVANGGKSMNPKAAANSTSIFTAYNAAIESADSAQLVGVLCQACARILRDGDDLEARIVVSLVIRDLDETEPTP
jgi:hypothetical protein